MDSKESSYGFCPICGSLGVSRERRLNGNDKCVNGHIYPSAKSKEIQELIKERDSKFETIIALREEVEGLKHNIKMAAKFLNNIEFDDCCNQTRVDLHNAIEFLED